MTKAPMEIIPKEKVLKPAESWFSRILSRASFIFSILVVHCQPRLYLFFSLPSPARLKLLPDLPSVMWGWFIAQLLWHRSKNHYGLSHCGTSTWHESCATGPNTLIWEPINESVSPLFQQTGDSRKWENAIRGSTESVTCSGAFDRDF